MYNVDDDRFRLSRTQHIQEAQDKCESHTNTKVLTRTLCVFSVNIVCFVFFGYGSFSFFSIFVNAIATKTVNFNL